MRAIELSLTGFDVRHAGSCLFAAEALQVDGPGGEQGVDPCV